MSKLRFISIFLISVLSIAVYGFSTDDYSEYVTNIEKFADPIDINSDFVVFVKIKTIDSIRVGSGVVISKNTVVTNYHVVDEALSVYVSKNGTLLDGIVMSVSKKDDLALVYVDKLKIRPAKLDRKAKDGYGVPVGFLDGQKHQQTVGQYFVGNSGHVFHENPVWPGQSGGAIVDASTNKVVGIISGYITDDKTCRPMESVAISVEAIYELISKLNSDKETKK